LSHHFSDTASQAQGVAESLDTVINAEAASLALNDTAAAAISSDLQAELQRILEHDSYEERKRLKELTRSELFTP
jgi:flagellar biosynthesis/type III secretory pathway chaperone